MAYLESNTEVDQNLSEYANDMNILMSCQTEKKFDEVFSLIFFHFQIRSLFSENYVLQDFFQYIFYYFATIM